MQNGLQKININTLKTEFYELCKQPREPEFIKKDNESDQKQISKDDFMKMEILGQFNLGNANFFLNVLLYYTKVNFTFLFFTLLTNFFETEHIGHIRPNLNLNHK